MQPDGASSRLEIRIDEKTYTSANGAKVVAVRGFELDLASGSLTALLGPSGCGKSTIMRILAGLDQDYKGRVHWVGEPRIGFVFQEPRLLPWRTVRQNIELAQSDELNANDIAQLADDAEITHVLDCFPGELSLGEARRAALVRAFSCAPNVLLLDEPFVSLDDASAHKLRRMLMKIWSNRPVTAVLVTHNLREALVLADRLLLLAPQPTKVIEDIPLLTARSERTEDKVDEMRAKLHTDYAEHFSNGQDVKTRQDLASRNSS